MKHFAQLSSMGLGLGLFILTAVTPSYATVVGALSLGSSGVMTVAPAALNAVSPSYLAVGAASYVVAPLTVSRPEIAPATVGSVAPLTFSGEPALGIALDSFAFPELGAAPLVVSPIILTATSPLPTSVRSISLAPTYGTVVSDVVGNFKVSTTSEPTELSVLPTYNTPYSPFVAPSPVPEPRSIALFLLLAGLLMGLVVKRLKSEA